MANVLASVSVFENEVRSERIVAGQNAARESGKTWGGSKPGRRICTSVAGIARATGVSRPTVYRVLGESN